MDEEMSLVILSPMALKPPSLPVLGDFVRATSSPGDSTTQSSEPQAPTRGVVGASETAVSANEAGETPSWQDALRRAVRSGRELCQVLELDPSRLGISREAEQDFPVFAPWEWIRRMRRGDEHDPLLRQVLATADELAPAPGFDDDPVGDQQASLSPGLVRKYRSRALLITTGACAIHCRYCFRRHFPYYDAPKSLAAWLPAIEQIEADEELDEVILSGGDPLTLTDARLAELVERLAEIPHLRRLRVHTRLPIVIPQRITSELIAWVRGTRLAPIVVVHANHPQEIDHYVEAALGRLINAGIPVLNQAVLLRGVNDDVQAMVDLCRRLVDLRVMPYYLHQLDRVRGASHFEVPIERGQLLMRELRGLLPGYAVPRYVQEVAGDASKRVIEAC
jgi:EF-P beta-lysylation protein EpmB